jgi:hypothetical protein
MPRRAVTMIVEPGWSSMWPAGAKNGPRRQSGNEWLRPPEIAVNGAQAWV